MRGGRSEESGVKGRMGTKGRVQVVDEQGAASRLGVRCKIDESEHIRRFLHIVAAGEKHCMY